MVKASSVQQLWHVSDRSVSVCLSDSFLLMTQFWLGSPRLIPELLWEGGRDVLVVDKGKNLLCLLSPQLRSEAAGPRLSESEMNFQVCVLARWEEELRAL